CAKPIGPNCVPQTVTEKEVRLGGNLQLNGPAMVGKRLSLGLLGASLRYPDPFCKGSFVEAPVDSFRWTVTRRPGASSALLTQTETLWPELVPDKAGAWEVTLTACPSGCVLTEELTALAITAVVDFSVVEVKEITVSGDIIAAELTDILKDTRIEISQTGA